LAQAEHAFALRQAFVQLPGRTMAALCFFCGCAKTLPNNPLGCGCRRALSDDADKARPQSATQPFFTKRRGAEDDDDFPNDTGPGFGKNAAHLDWSHTPKTVVLKDGDAQCFITTAQSTQRKRQHPHHLVREFRIEPSPLAKNIKLSNEELLTHPMRQEIRLCEKDVRNRSDKFEVSSECSIPPVKPDKQKSFTDKHPLVSGSGGQHRESWRRSPGQAREIHAAKGCNMADQTLQGTAQRRNVASKTMCSQMSRKPSNNKRSSSLPALGSSREFDGSCVPEPQRGIKKSLGFKVAYALGATGKLLRTWN